MAFRSDLIELFRSLLGDQIRREKAAFLADEERRENAESFTEADGHKFSILNSLPAQQLTPWEYAVRWLHSTHGLKWLDDCSEYVDPEPIHGGNLREFLAICHRQDAGSHDMPNTEIASDLQQLNREGVTAKLKEVLRDHFGELLGLTDAADVVHRPDDSSDAAKTELPTVTYTKSKKSNDAMAAIVPTVKTCDALDKEFPAFDATDANWVSSKVAAKVLGVSTKRLSNRRHEQPCIKCEGNGERFGIHDEGLFWRVVGKNDVHYYLPEMKSHAGHLAKTYPKADRDRLR